MKITRIESILLNLPMDVRAGVPMPGGVPKRNLDALLVRVETDSGITGWGEAFALTSARATHAAIEHVIAPRAIGLDASNIALVMHDLSKGLHNAGRSGPVVFGLSALDIALWDIAGKHARQPLHRLLGGNRAALPAYASLMRYADVETIVAKANEALTRGYRFLKLHEHRPDVLRAVRDALGPEVPLMVDCNCPWNAEEAVRVAREIDDLELFWLEEPIYPPDDRAGYAHLRATGIMPVAGGENLSNVTEFRDMLVAGGLSYVQPSVTKVGGITEMRKIMVLTEAFGAKFVPHSPYFGPGFAASVHLCAAAAKETWIERYYCDFEQHPFGAIIDPREGDIVVPEGPGLGADPDMAIVEKLRVA